jgi:putative ABC transport system permease protein
VVPERYAEIAYAGDAYTIRALDIAGFQAMGGQLLLESGDPEAVYAQLRNHDHPSLLAGGFEALGAGLKQVGRIITLDAHDGPAAFEVVGVLRGTADPTLVMDWTLYAQLWQDARVDRLLLTLQPEAGVQAERRDLLARYASQGVMVADRDQMRALMGNPSDSYGILGYLMMPFMVLGIANTLFIAVLDRRRETGMLRAVGTLRRHIVGSIILEALLLIGLACLVAIPAAYYVVDMMLFERITGVPISPTPSAIVITVVLVLAAGAVSAFIPARRAGRIDVLAALRHE